MKVDGLYRELQTPGRPLGGPALECDDVFSVYVVVLGRWIAR
jgi:hypothetical protein